jgi:hypothetical protein
MPHAYGRAVPHDLQPQQPASRSLERSEKPSVVELTIEVWDAWGLLIAFVINQSKADEDARTRLTPLVPRIRGEQQPR